MAKARPDSGGSSSELIDNLYKVEPNRWYKAYPYGFAFSGSKTKQGDIAEEIFLLPIAPNNINTTTHFATNIVTTLYGIVEEHSEVSYYDIVISGNTGIAPKNVLPTTGSLSVKRDPFNQPSPNPVDNTKPSIGRSSFKPGSGLVGSLGGFLPEVTNTLNAAANLVKSVTTNADSVNETGIAPTQSGYYAFHNFYKFLLRYKQDVSSRNSSSGLPNLESKIGGGSNGKGNNIRQTHPLQFLNYKDNIQYDVIPISFTLTRSADNPLLYVYNIKLRAFNLRNVASKSDSNNLLADLGLGDIKGSLFSKMTGVVGKASTLISGLGGIR